MSELLSLIENELEFQKDKLFGGIFGLNPSAGARSPILWRAAFEALDINANFYPLDVKLDNLGLLIEKLKEDERFIGGACAVPYKEKLAKFLDHIEPEAVIIGAVNAIYKNTDGAFVGANTDGAAALTSLEDKVGSLVGKNILLLGLGGAGKAVATYVANAKANVTIWNRTTEKAVYFADRFNGKDMSVTAVESLSTSIMKKCDLLINCTSLGHSSDGTVNAAMPIDTQSLNLLPDFALVYDIIYQPQKSTLLAAAENRGLDTMNGLKMNLDQAVIAFCKAFPNSNYDSVMNAMQKI